MAGENEGGARPPPSFLSRKYKMGRGAKIPKIALNVAIIHVFVNIIRFFIMENPKFSRASRAVEHVFSISGHLDLVVH